MKITRDNIAEVSFENHDAKLLIQEVILHTSVSLYYFGEEISIMQAINIYNRAIKADEEMDQLELDTVKCKYRSRRRRLYQITA